MAFNKKNILLSRFADPLLTPKGRLKVDVFNTTVARPIENARIDIFSRNQNGEESQIETLVTNNSGQTLEILLDAPPKEYSLVPEDELRPFSTYNISVSAEGFSPLRVEGIEILEDTTAIQGVTMAPIEGENGSDTIVIRENSLWGDYPPKAPEDDIKEIPPATGFVVLDEPIIPEFIVVHDGPPDSNAPNYYIPFIDYIKNAASSEIFPTWPEETIRANVLAIISFTLNRVFTVILY